MRRKMVRQIFESDFRAPPDLVSAARESVVKDAAQNARAEAEAAVKALGRDIGSVIHVDSFQLDREPKGPSRNHSALDGASREQIVSANVSVSFKIV